MFTIACCLAVRLGLGLDLVSGWLVVPCTRICTAFDCNCHTGIEERVMLQAQPVPASLVSRMLGNRVAVSPIVTIEPRRRKFHRPITLTMPLPRAVQKGMLNQYGGGATGANSDAPTLRLLCSIMGECRTAVSETVVAVRYPGGHWSRAGRIQSKKISVHKYYVKFLVELYMLSDS